MLLQLNIFCAFISQLLNTSVSWEMSAMLAQSAFLKVSSDYNKTFSDVHAYKMLYSHTTVIYIDNLYQDTQQKAARHMLLKLYLYCTWGSVAK